MTYQLIVDQLQNAGIDLNFNLHETKIIELMLLERAGVLGLLEPAVEPTYADTAESNYRHSDNLARSEINLDLKDEDKTGLAKQIAKALQYRFVRGMEMFNQLDRTFYKFHLPTEDVEASITKSALFRAAGDLSTYSEITALYKLQSDLKLYEKVGGKIQKLAQSLSNRIDNFIQKQNKLPESISVWKSLGKGQHECCQRILHAQAQFDMHFATLEVKLDELIGKARKNTKSFDPAYQKVAVTAQTLSQSLKNARNEFFDFANGVPTQASFNKFKTDCLSAIAISKHELSEFRVSSQFYNDLHPILQDFIQGTIECIAFIAGILAFVAFPVGIAVQLYSKQGYYGTFFDRKTDSRFELDKFAAGLQGENAVIEEIESNMASFN